VNPVVGLEMMKYEIAILGLLVLASCGHPPVERSGSPSLKLTGAEKRLMAIRVPEIDFRSANLFDMLLFLDHSVAQYGTGPETNAATRVRITWTPALEAASADKDYQCYLLPKTEDVSILEALQTIVEGAAVQYISSNQWVIVDLKQERRGPTT